MLILLSGDCVAPCLGRWILVDCSSFEEPGPCLSHSGCQLGRAAQPGLCGMLGVEFSPAPQKR